MYLFVAATDLEMNPFLAQAGTQANHPNIEYLVSGIGCLETAFKVTQRLVGSQANPWNGVIQFGVGGAYLETGLALLDLCIAEHEELAEFGIRLDDELIPFEPHIAAPDKFSLSCEFSRQCRTLLDRQGYHSRAVRFLTVNTATGSARVGNELKKRYGADCENMEGAAAARVCQALNIPFFELRVISNMVEDRNLKNWKLVDACHKAAQAAACLARELNKSNV